MKKVKKILAASIVLFGATATTTANNLSPISTPLTISLVNNMSFGNITAAPACGGTMVLSPEGTITVTGGVKRPAIPSWVAAAMFTVSGLPEYAYTISVPENATLSNDVADTMKISKFTSSPAGNGLLNPSGTQTIKVGATLTIAKAQAAGVYTNTTEVKVTVNYN